MLFITKAKLNQKEIVTSFLVDEDLSLVELDKFLPTFMIAELDGEQIGTAGIEIYGTNGLLRSIVITKEHRNQQLGSTLVKSVLNMADLRGVKQVYALASNKQQEEFLARFGFAVVGRQDIEQACGESKLLQQMLDAQPMILSLDGYFTSHHCDSCSKRC